MDPDYSAQDVARCDLCKTTIAQSYCDFCHVNLCKPCIGEHISDEYDKHKIVPFQKRRSTLKYPKCAAHQYDACKHQCKNCEEFVCSYCTASEQHKGHEFLKLEEIFITKKEHIQNDTEELKNHIIPTFEEITINLENEISNLDDQYEQLTTEITKHGEELHREIDNIITKMGQEIIEIKLKHSSILTKHLDEIKDIQSEIKKALTALNEMEESNEVSLIIHYSSKNKVFRKCSLQVHVLMPKFIPQKLERGKSCSFFGELTPLSERVLTAKNPHTSVRELLDEPEVLNTIDTGFKVLRNVTCLDDKRVWTSGDIGNIKCFSIQGELQETLNTMSGDWPRDLTGDKNRALLYSQWKTRTVYKVKNDQTEEIIRLQGWHPLNLCATSSGDLLVTMYSDDKTQSKVVRYFGSTVKQTIEFDEEGQALYSGNSFFKYIGENRNLDVCVADWAAGAVVVVNQAGKLQFRYTACPSVAKNRPFVPRGITTDSQSHILTADGGNHCIHILDEDGQLLRYIHNLGLKQLFGLCVDINDNLFVCEQFTGNVKQIKYLK